jgi:hypothetical protein
MANGEEPAALTDRFGYGMRTISDRAGLTIALVLTLAVWGAGMAVIIWGAQPLALQTAVEKLRLLLVHA